MRRFKKEGKRVVHAGGRSWKVSEMSLYASDVKTKRDGYGEKVEAKETPARAV